LKGRGLTPPPQGGGEKITGLVWDSQIKRELLIILGTKTDREEI
jgi:hypothetical protein